MITVNIWPYRGKEIAYGHASISIDGGTPAGNLYISWWPQAIGRRVKRIHDKLYCVAPIPNRNYEDDIRGEDDNLPSERISIDGGNDFTIGLNETAIKTWWYDLVLKGSTDWCTLGPNCSTISAWALYTGGGDTFADSLLTLSGVATTFGRRMTFPNMQNRLLLELFTREVGHLQAGMGMRGYPEVRSRKAALERYSIRW